jgi:hypothetical protein
MVEAEDFEGRGRGKEGGQATGITSTITRAWKPKPGGTWP